MLNSKSLTAKNGEIAFMLDGEFRIIVHFLIADQPLEAHCEGQQKTINRYTKKTYEHTTSR